MGSTIRREPLTVIQFRELEQALTAREIAVANLRAAEDRLRAISALLGELKNVGDGDNAELDRATRELVITTGTQET